MLANLQPQNAYKCIKFPPNPRVSRPWLLLSAVGKRKKPSCFKIMVALKCCRLPTYSPKMPQVPSKPSCFKTMVAFKCCRLPTYSPKMPQVPSKPSCFKIMGAFKCCRLPTYSPKMPQVPSNSSISSPPWLLLSAAGCQPTAPKCLKFPPTPVFQALHGCF